MLVDVAPAMLEVAEKRFDGHDAGRVTFQLLDYGKQPLRGTYDLVISALSIHHLAEGEKQTLFARIFRVLEPGGLFGGLFINADQVLGENPVADKIYKWCWLQKVRASDISQEALGAALQRMDEDRLSPLASQLDWLETAGFDEITVWYKYCSFVVYSGMKPLAGKSHARQNNI